MSLTLAAATMVVDVSRYTALVEQFARRGQNGLEQIPILLGRSYDRCVEIINEYGGEVVFVVGDAMLAYWPNDEGLGEAVRKAAACAESICRQDSGGSDGRSRDDQLGFHIGIGAGLVWTAALGGRPLWNLVVGGDAVVQAASAQGRARRWRYELSAQAAAALADAGVSYGPRALQVEACSEPPPDWLAGFLPPILREAASNGERGAARLAPDGESLDRLAEIRPITALFARFVGLDPHASDALARHHALCAALQDDVSVRGGPAGDLYVDDKGLVFTAAFGAFGSFHRDDAARAVDAARAIFRTAQAQGLTASLGVSTGDALFRVVGNARRRQFLVLGGQMNRAARLMSAQASGIFCDAPTERASRTAFAFEERGNLHLAGLEHKAAVFSPIERRQSATARASPVGRARELAELESALAEAASGSSGLLVVTGEPGIGKTTLVQAFADSLAAPARVVTVTPGERDDQRASFLPWRRVIASLLDLKLDADGSAILDAIRDRARGRASLLARLGLLDAILGVGIPQVSEVRHLEGPHRADATMRLIGDVIAALAPRPMAIVLDNAQWLDSASWRLVEWALSSIDSLLTVVCVRSGEEPTELCTLQRKLELAARRESGRARGDQPRFFRSLDLAELDAQSMSGVVARALGEAPVEPELGGRIAALSDGNPLFAEEIALALKARASIVMRSGVWRPMRPLEPLQSFEGVERVIRERVDRLDGSVQTILRAASVIGRSFSIDALAALMRDVMRRDTLEASVEALIRVRLVCSGASVGHYEFRHDQIRDVVYNSTPSDLRRRLHGTLAEWMDRGDLRRSVNEIVVLAKHFQASGDLANAVKYADLAATRALELGAYREVRAFIGICLGQEGRRRALNSAQKLRAVRWRRQLGEAHYNLGDLNAQGVCVKEALALAGEPVPETAAALVARVGIEAWGLLWRKTFGAPQDGRDGGRSGIWEKELTRCLNLAAVVDYFELRFTRSFYHTIVAAIHGERAGPSVERAVAFAQLACGLGILGFSGGARRLSDLAENAVVALEDPAAHARICILDSLWRMGRCEWNVIDARLVQAEALCTAAGDQLSWCNVHALRFWSLYYRGDLAALERTAHALLARAQNSGNLQQENWALRCKALCHMHSGSPRDAIEILRINTDSTLVAGDLAERVSSTGVLALALSRAGLHAESVEAAVETTRILDVIGRPTVHSILPGVAGATEVLLRGRESGLASDYNEWPRWERQILRHLERFRRTFPLGESQYGLWSGVAMWLDGKRDRAMSAWNRALDVARHRSLGQDEAMIAAEIRRRQYEPMQRSLRLQA